MTESFRSGDAKGQLQQEQDVLREAMRKLAREILVALVVAVANAMEHEVEQYTSDGGEMLAVAAVPSSSSRSSSAPPGISLGRSSEVEEAALVPKKPLPPEDGFPKISEEPFRAGDPDHAKQRMEEEQEVAVVREAMRELARGILAPLIVATANARTQHDAATPHASRGPEMAAALSSSSAPPPPLPSSAREATSSSGSEDVDEEAEVREVLREELRRMMESFQASAMLVGLRLKCSCVLVFFPCVRP